MQMEIKAWVKRCTNELNPIQLIRLMWSSAFEPIDFDQLILFGSAEVFFVPGQLWITPEDGLWVECQSSHESNQM